MSFQNVGTYNAGVFTPKAAGPAPVGACPSWTPTASPLGAPF